MGYVLSNKVYSSRHCAELERSHHPQVVDSYKG